MVNPSSAVMCFTCTMGFDIDSAWKIISYGLARTTGAPGRKSQVYLVSLWVRDLHGANLPNG